MTVLCSECGQQPVSHKKRQLCKRCYARFYRNKHLAPLKHGRAIAKEISEARKAERLRRIREFAEARQSRLDDLHQRRLDRAAQYLRQLSEGLSLAEVAARAGISRQRVQQCIKSAGLKPPIKARKPLYVRRSKEQARRDAIAGVIANLESRILRRGPDECWPWVGPTWAPNPRCARIRYARIHAFDPLNATKKRSTLVHRVVYLLNRGPIPDGMTVDHICFNTLCCNPAHLQLLTRSANSARKKGKAPNPDRSEAQLSTSGDAATSAVDDTSARGGEDRSNEGDRK